MDSWTDLEAQRHRESERSAPLIDPVPRHGGRVEEAARKYGFDPEEILDFSANINPLGPPSGLKEVVDQALESISRYPDDQYPRFRTAISDFLEDLHSQKLEPNQIVPGNGSVEIIRILLHYLRKTGGNKSVLIPTPAFSEYFHQSKILGLKTEQLPLDDLISSRSSQLEEYGLVFLCNPNNPTGVLVDEGTLQNFVTRCRKANTMVVIDEAFIELTEPSQSSIEFLPKRRNLVLIRSLTKNFSLPGARIGYGLAQREVAEELDKFRPSWNLNAFAVEMTPHILDESREFLARTRQYINRERSYLSGALSRLGMKVYSSKANFILTDCKEIEITASELTGEMARRKILLRDASTFKGLDRWHVRIAVRTKDQNRQLIKTLENLLP